MHNFCILKLIAKAESDLLVTRFRTKQIADLAGMSTIEKTQFVVAVAEIVRNAVKYAGEARVQFRAELIGREQFIIVTVSDSGPGFSVDSTLQTSTASKGIKASKKFVDQFHIESNGSGTTVEMHKRAHVSRQFTEYLIGEWVATLKKNSPFSVVEDLEQQNKLLLDTLSELEKIKVKLEERTDQLNQANKHKGEFLANMSHEIRTPMNAIIGMSNIMDRTELTADQRKFMSLIRQSSSALLDIINDILDFSKIEAGKLTIESARFDLYDVVETCMEVLFTNAHSKGLSLLSWIDPDVPREVTGDSVRLKQILVNLTSNALKFTHEGEVVARLKVVKRENDDVVVRFEVIDNGIGLSPEKQAKLFQPFVQADGSTSRKYGGTGLGLSICKQLVELMDGRIGVDSVEGAGSTFWFELPYMVPPERPETREKPTFKKALIVDDQVSMCEMGRFLLNSWDIDTVSAASPREALKVVAEDDFDLFILDYVLPEMDGLELAQKIRESDRARGARIILLTAFHEAGLGEKAISSGCDAYLTKPLRQQQLYDCLVALSGTGKFTPPTFKAVTTRAVTTRAAATTTIDGAAADRSPSSEIPYSIERPSTIAELKRPVEDDAKLYEVLLVEDNPTNQIVAGIELEHLGCRATVANNGEEAIAILKQKPFALILMDCQMPVMNGYEATRSIRQRECKTGKRIPIIAMTANAMESDRDQCLAAGMDDYISKPFQTEELRSKLDKWLGTAAGGAICADGGTASDGAAADATAGDGAAADATSGDGAAPSEGGGDDDGDSNAIVIDYEKFTKKFNEKQAKQLLAVFCTDTTKQLSTLGELVANRDFDALAKLAHSIKGAASMIFAEGVATEARALEQAAKAQDSDLLAKLHVRLSKQFDKLKEYAEQELQVSK